MTPPLQPIQGCHQDTHSSATRASTGQPLGGSSAFGGQSPRSCRQEVLAGGGGMGGVAVFHPQKTRPRLFLLDELPSAVCWALRLKQGAIKRENSNKRGKWKEAKRNAAKRPFLLSLCAGNPQDSWTVSHPCARRGMALTPRSPATTGPREQEGPRRRLRGPGEGREPGGGLSRRSGAQGRSWGETAAAFAPPRGAAVRGGFCHRIWWDRKVGPHRDVCVSRGALWLDPRRLHRRN